MIHDHIVIIVMEAGWRAAGITDVLKEARRTGCTSTKPILIVVFLKER